jgi:hypothetical protein
MGRLLVLLGYLLLPSLGRCQSVTGSVGGSTETNNDFTRTDRAINMYADSLNFLSIGASLPLFLSDTLLDWKLYNDYGLHIHNYFFSFRRLVIDRVLNEDALLRIITSSDLKYDYIYNPEALIKQRRKRSSTVWFHDYINLPYQDVTLRQMARDRLETVKRLRGDIGVKK